MFQSISYNYVMGNRQDCIKEGFNQLTVILDNNSTHKNILGNLN